MLLAVLFLVVLVNIPRFLDETIRESVRASVLQAAKIAIPLKDSILRRTITDKLIRIQSTGACEFCDLRNADLREMDLDSADLRWANLSETNLSRVDLSGMDLTG